MEKSICKKIAQVCKAEFAKITAPEMEEKLRHIEGVKKILELLGVSEEEADMFASTHDIGRIPQLKLLNGFKDGTVLHHYLGEDFLMRMAFNHTLELTDELRVAIMVCSYHGRIDFMPYKEFLPEEVLKYIDLVSTADDIENGCLGAVRYLAYEALYDLKDYRKNNPELDQRSVSADVLKFFLSNEKFDKMKYCHTYAEYFLFAAILAIKSYEKCPEIARKALEMPNGKYSSSLEGYRDLFARYISEEYSEICYNHLLDVIKK